MASADLRSNEDDDEPDTDNEEEDDAIERCPRCNDHFATEVAADLSWPLPVPISCRQCGGITLCKNCVDRVAQCFACGHASTDCFDKTVPNVAFCRALDRIRELKARTITTCTISAATTDGAEAATEEDEEEETPLKTGDRAYCLWEENGLYYPGRVAVVLDAPEQASSSTAGQPTSASNYRYTIHFDDGDVRFGAPRHEILTLEEAQRKDLVVAPAGVGTENQQTYWADHAPQQQQGGHTNLMGRRQEGQPPAKKGKHMHC